MAEDLNLGLTTTNLVNGQKQDLNSEPPDYKSSALTARQTSLPVNIPINSQQQSANIIIYCNICSENVNVRYSPQQVRQYVNQGCH